MVVDISTNKKQEEYFNVAVEAVFGRNDYRNLNYGGAIRGGKTFINLACLCTFGAWFPESRWHIFRADFPALQSSTIPSLQKILAGSKKWGWNRDKANFFAYHRQTDSKIFFKGENISRDPELNDLLGMETNGIFFEQIEELSEKLWQIGQSRVGSWYIPKMPKPLTFATFNPTQKWIKEKIYIPYLNGTLKPPYYFLPALPNENPFVTAEQWAVWSTLAERYQKQFIEGDWTDFADKNNLWAFAFDEKKHVYDDFQADFAYPVYLSFDFNKNPICASVIQWIEGSVRVIETIKLANSDIYELCNYIQAKYGGATFLITGDASGSSASALVKDNLTYYKVIRAQLGLTLNQFDVPTVNPSLEKNQVLVNSLLSHYPIFISRDAAKGLIFDLKNVRVEPGGSQQIEKGDRKDPTKQADALDTFRYFCNTYLSNFINYVRNSNNPSQP